jgi:hypothetical protein
VSTGSAGAPLRTAASWELATPLRPLLVWEGEAPGALLLLLLLLVGW